jgi:hypothetical protein
MKFPALHLDMSRPASDLSGVSDARRKRCCLRQESRHVWQTVMTDLWRLAETWCQGGLACQPHGRCIKEVAWIYFVICHINVLEPHVSTCMSKQGSVHMHGYAGHSPLDQVRCYVCQALTCDIDSSFRSDVCVVGAEIYGVGAGKPP